MSEVLAKIGFDFSLFVFNLINFLVIGYLLYRFFYKKIATTLQERQELIALGVKKAEKSESLLLKANMDALEIVANAKKEAAQTLAEAKKLGEANLSELKQQAQSTAAKVLTRAEQEAELLRKQRLQEVEGEITDLVVKTAEKLIENNEEISNQNAQAYLNQSKSNLKS